MNRTKGIYLALLVMLLPMAANADFISADSATATSNYSSHFNPQYTTNCSGLTVCNETGLVTHDAANNLSGYQWVASQNNIPATLRYDFHDAVSAISGFYLWNAYYAPGGQADRSVREFDLTFYSGLVALGTESFTASGTETLGAEYFGGFLYANVDSVELHIRNNYGNYFTWFHEVGFDSVSDVPEPGTLALLGLGLFGVAARRRKKV